MLKKLLNKKMKFLKNQQGLTLIELLSCDCDFGDYCGDCDSGNYHPKGLMLSINSYQTK